MFIYCLSVFFCFLRNDVVIENAKMTYRFFAFVCDVYSFKSESFFFSIFYKRDKMFERFGLTMLII